MLGQGTGLLVLPSGEDLVTPASGPDPIQSASPWRDSRSGGAAEPRETGHQLAATKVARGQTYLAPAAVDLATAEGAVLEVGTVCTNLVSNNCTLSGKFLH
ncbi:hypothetical protein NDU88_007819 [Pleurodeles waltl]|uniref:DUF4280 domain-containing protein n=1 Tax=Pleurodeles waltl TaxID=8319 RepID=A0AAV7VUK3_PLEWA|nr:hypothetical protein NDU88_007819 [Pleurodeles waltl]